jgi:hypothetical protein
MPDQPSYIERLPAILANARTPRPLPFFQREDIETLFGLRRRQAINLMHRVGAVRTGNAITVDQRDVVRWIERVMQSPAVVREPLRRARVIEKIVELKAEAAARAIRITLPPGPERPDLPEGVTLAPGILAIRFTGQQQLLERLFGLARTLAADPKLLESLDQLPI